MRDLSLRLTKKLPRHHHVTKQVGTISSQTQKLAKSPKTPIDADFLGLKQFLGLKFRWAESIFFFAGGAEPPL